MSAGQDGEVRRFEYVTANDVFAGLVDGGTIRVEEWPGGDLAAMVPRLERVEGVLIVELANDIVGGSPNDCVSMHPDESNRLDMLNRAIRAFENARDALTACGYVDLDERRSA